MRKVKIILSFSIISVLMVGLLSMAILPSRTYAIASISKVKADSKRLYIEHSGKTFTPRGANFVRLAQDASGATYHSTFQPGKYNDAAAQAFLNKMKQYGYNTARVFIDPGNAHKDAFHGIGENIGSRVPISAPYMDNFARFVQHAAQRGIYVLPSLDMFPQNQYYWDIVAQTNKGVGTPNMEGRNLSYMDKGRVAAKVEYIKQFSKAMRDRLSPSVKTAILAYQTDNEIYFEANKAPYNKTSGTVKPLNGVTYDMSKANDRQQAADASVVEYLHRVKRGLQAVGDSTMLTAGFFTNHAVGRTSYNGLPMLNGTENRVPGRPASVAHWAPVDFIDIHLYASSPTHNPLASLSSVEEAHIKKPYIIGEFGARNTPFANSISRGAAAMKDIQTKTCSLGAQGWIAWTWDTHEALANQHLFFKMNESSGVIAHQLSPIYRPNPCK